MDSTLISPGFFFFPSSISRLRFLMILENRDSCLVPPAKCIGNILEDNIYTMRAALCVSCIAGFTGGKHGIWSYIWYAQSALMVLVEAAAMVFVFQAGESSIRRALKCWLCMGRWVVVVTMGAADLWAWELICGAWEVTYRAWEVNCGTWELTCVRENWPVGVRTNPWAWELICGRENWPVGVRTDLWCENSLIQ